MRNKGVKTQQSSEKHKSENKPPKLPPDGHHHISIFTDCPDKKESFKTHCGKKTLALITGVALHLLLIKIPDTCNVSFV